MTRASHVIPSRTAARLDRMRTLIATLQSRRVSRAEMGSILQVGSSGVRKYLSDLKGKVELGFEAGEQVCRWIAAPDETSTFVASLAARAPTQAPRPSKSVIGIAMRDPARHIHIMQDDVVFSVRVQNGIPSHEPVMAAFFGLSSVEARV